jgi:hypothetical protein
LEFADFDTQSSVFVFEDFDSHSLDPHGLGQGLDGFDIIGLGWGTGAFTGWSDCGDGATEGVVGVGLGSDFFSVIMTVSIAVC